MFPLRRLKISKQISEFSSSFLYFSRKKHEKHKKINEKHKKKHEKSMKNHIKSLISCNPVFMAMKGLYSACF